MTTKIYVAGNEVSREFGTLQIVDKLDQRSTASFNVIDEGGVVDYQKGESVQIVNGSGDVGNWLQTWKHRVMLTVDGSFLSSNVTHFPVMLRISSSCGSSSTDLTRVFDELGSDSLKIAVTKSDGLTQLYVEIEKWDDTGEEAILWISKSDWTIIKSQDNYIYLYYDADQDDNSSYVGIPGSGVAENVWNTYYKAVWHMNDDPDTSHILDSTSNDSDGTKSGAGVPAEATGEIAYGQENSSDGYITIPDLDILTASWKVSFLIKPVSDNTDFDRILAINAGGHTVDIAIKNYKIGINYDGDNTSRLSSVCLTQNVWSSVTIHFLKYYTYFYQYIYVDGVLISNVDSGPPNVATHSRLFGGYDTGAYRFDGYLDEVKISTGNVSQTPPKFEYNSCMDTLIEISESDDNILFAGFIDIPKERRIFPSENDIRWVISCIDNHYLADKRIAAESYTSQTSAYIVNDLITKYLAAEGITAGTIQTGVTIAEFVINYQYITRVLDTLASRCGFIWYINKFKQLFFTTSTTTDAPFSVGGSGADIVRDRVPITELAHSAPDYRNRQYGRAGKDQTALQTENFTGDGATVAFTVGYPIAKEPTVTVAGNPQTVGIKGLETSKDCYWNKGDATLTFSSAPAGAAAIVIQYYGEFDIIVLVEDVTAQSARAAIEGGSGIVEHMSEFPSIDDRNDALDAAGAELSYYKIIGQQFKFPIRVPGLQPGQIVLVTDIPYGLSSTSLLVDSVTVTEIAPGELRFNIIGIDGPLVGDWTDFFKKLADIKPDIMERITVGSSTVLVLLIQYDELTEVSEDITCTIYACSTPANSGLYPADSGLYPC